MSIHVHVLLYDLIYSCVGFKCGKITYQGGVKFGKVIQRTLNKLKLKNKARVS